MTDSPTIMRTYKFRCYPPPEAREKANRIMARIVKPIWNAAQAQRRENFEAWLKADEAGKKAHQWISWYDQRHLIDKASYPEYDGTQFDMRDRVLTTLDASYKAFRRLRKNGHKDAMPPGPMGFCGWVKFMGSGWKLQDAGPRWRRHWPHCSKVVILAGIGEIPVRLHRGRIERQGGKTYIYVNRKKAPKIWGRIKEVTLRVKNGQWYVCFACEIENFQGACGSLYEPKSKPGQRLRQKHPRTGVATPELEGAHNDRDHGRRPRDGVVTPAKKSSVSLTLDVDGLFLRDSRGREVAIPGFYQASIETERRLSREKSALQPKPGQPASKNYRKAKRRLRRFRQHIANQRSDWLWNLAYEYATNYRRVTVWTRPAKPPIQWARDAPTAMRLQDGAFALFAKRLEEKSVEHGMKFIVKEKPTWPNEKEGLTEQAKLETLQPVLREAKRRVRRNPRASTKSLQRACERLTTLQIS